MTRKALQARRIVTSLAVGYLVAYLFWQAAGAPGDAPLIGDLAIIPPTLLAVLACARAARSVGDERRLIWGWRLIALALLAFLGGEITQLIYELTPGEYPFPSLSDPFYLALYPLFFAGLIRFADPRRGRSFRVVLDTLTIAIGGAAMVWFVVLGPTAYGDTGGTFPSLVMVAYPVGDLVLVFALAGLLADPPWLTERLPLGLLTAGAVTFVFADSIYDRLVLDGSYSGGNPVDTLYIAAMLVFALAASSQREATTPAPDTDDATAPRPRLAWIPYLALAAVFGILIGSQIGQPFFPDLSLTLAAAALAAVIALRQMLARHELIAVHAQLRAAHRELAEMAATDPVTGLPNQRALAATIDAELARRLRSGRPCTMLFLDIDHFKRVNDTFGHATGDAVLRELGEVVTAELRAVDGFGRWGGEEFVAMLPGIDAAAAMPVAERVRAAVAAHDFRGIGGSRMTVSIGVAAGLDGDREELLAAADAALYVAKHDGRDRVRRAGRNLGAPLVG
jgi:diguanylate cyclase (GGDEF)-like protein